MRMRFEDLKPQKHIKIYDKETLMVRITTRAICDLLPEYWYEKRYHYKHKEFYITTNHRFYFSDKSTLTSLKLYKDNGAKKDKLIPFNRIYKIVRIIIKDLIQVGIVEKVKK